MAVILQHRSNGVKDPWLQVVVIVPIPVWPLTSWGREAGTYSFPNGFPASKPTQISNSCAPTWLDLSMIPLPASSQSLSLSQSWSHLSRSLSLSPCLPLQLWVPSRSAPSPPLPALLAGSASSEQPGCRWEPIDAGNSLSLKEKIAQQLGRWLLLGLLSFHSSSL